MFRIIMTILRPLIQNAGNTYGHSRAGSSSGPRSASAQDALGAELHAPPCPGIFPQARAVVSKIFSDWQAGFRYGLRRAVSG
jgi:hypothetical protein